MLRWFAGVKDYRAAGTRRRLAAGLFSLVAILVLVIRAGAAGPQDPDKQLINFLEDETGWYRQLGAFVHGEATPEEILLQQSVAESAQRACKRVLILARGRRSP